MSHSLLCDFCSSKGTALNSSDNKLSHYRRNNQELFGWAVMCKDLAHSPWDFGMVTVFLVKIPFCQAMVRLLWVFCLSDWEQTNITLV